MAITITEVSGVNTFNYDKNCIAFPQEFVFGIDFGADITGKLVNIDFYMFEDLFDMNPPLFVNSFGGPPRNGYNWIGATSGWTTINLASAASGKNTWKNYLVQYQQNTNSTARVRLFFMHSMELESWIFPPFGPRQNQRRLFHSTESNPQEFDVTAKTYYDTWNAERYVGVNVDVYNPADEVGKWLKSDTKIQRFYYPDGWWWNPKNSTQDIYPHSFVHNYYWALSRAGIPVSSLSSSDDTDIKLTLVTHVGYNYGSISAPDIAESYQIGLVHMDNYVNAESFIDEIPVPIGSVTALNTFGTANSWLLNTIGGVEIVTNCTLASEVTTNNWEMTFKIPKEVVQIGKSYRIFVIVKNTFTGEPV